MNCSQIEEYSSLYIDEMLTEEEMLMFKKHLETCENCSLSLENLKVIVNTVKEMEEVDLPTDFTLSLRKKLQKEHEKKEQREKGQEKKKELINWKLISGIAAGLVITAISMTTFEILKPAEMTLEGLMTESNEMMAKDMEVAAEEENSFNPSSRALEPSTFNTFEVSDNDKEEVGISTMDVATDNRKIINKGKISLETNGFDEAYQNIYSLVEQYGGYFQISDTQYYLLDRENPEESLRTANLIIRVPSDNFNEIFNGLKLTGVVIHENTNSEDITLTYRDIENEVANLEVQEERLRELLKKAEKVDDILRIENELARVRLQINSMKGTLKDYDHLISLSTVEIELIEVKENAAAVVKLQTIEEGLWSRGKDNFIKSLNQIISFMEAVIINLYGLIPWGLLVTAITLPVVSIGKKMINKRRNNIEQ